MRSIITFAAVILVAGMIVPQFARQMYTPRAPQNLMAARQATPLQPVSSNPDSVTVTPDPMGHFRIEGRVDGQYLQFVVDTGASVVALTAEDAATIRPRLISGHWSKPPTARCARRQSSSI
jgi:aspartyl protease family protein